MSFVGILSRKLSSRTTFPSNTWSQVTTWRFKGLFGSSRSQTVVGIYSFCHTGTLHTGALHTFIYVKYDSIILMLTSAAYWSRGFLWWLFAVLLLVRSTLSWTRRWGWFFSDHHFHILMTRWFHCENGSFWREGCGNHDGSGMQKFNRCTESSVEIWGGVGSWSKFNKGLAIVDYNCRLGLLT